MKTEKLNLFWLYVQTLPLAKRSLSSGPSWFSIPVLLKNTLSNRIYGSGDIEWQIGIIPSVWRGISERLVSGMEAFTNILSGTKKA